MWYTQKNNEFFFFFFNEKDPIFFTSLLNILEIDIRIEFSIKKKEILIL